MQMRTRLAEVQFLLTKYYWAPFVKIMWECDGSSCLETACSKMILLDVVLCVYMGSYVASVNILQFMFCCEFTSCIDRCTCHVWRKF